ncbi:hypothetical protein [Nocardioides marmorisolisilvae]|uniref:Lipoprotein n=1 Tax=Nocardioides marmorisolisilvae TaxID=1542737 RepID=A0A3N0DJQ1_9ACTN|nr:hypothetical protein [Nocardioides marmorisolisilvae]RNL75473.1 hypothetical protein EFL95_18885 [Nocardioides marmorisolisilvae]
MKKALPAALGVLVLLLATACGGVKLTKTEQKISKTIATAISKPDDALLSKKDATCVADKFVGDVGEKKLKSAKAVAADDSYNTNGANVDKKTSNAFSKALLDCINEKDALKAYDKTVTTAFEKSTTGVLDDSDVTCFASKFVKTAGVQRLLSSQVITDTGEFNTAGADLDAKTSGNYADAFLGCVDYQKVQAQQVAKSDKTIDAAKLEACFKRTMPISDIKKLIVANQTQSSDATALNAASDKKASACAKSSKK